MKRIAMGILVCLTIALLIGCERHDAPADTSVEIDGKQAVISQMNGTVTIGENVYRYAYSADGQLVIVYPNEFVYARKTITAGGTTTYTTSFVTAQGVPSDQTAEEFGYIGGDALAAALDGVMVASAKSGDNTALAIVFVLLGAWLFLAPRSAWAVGQGRKGKGAGPSETARVFYRVIGAGLIVAAIVMFAVRQQ